MVQHTHDSLCRLDPYGLHARVMHLMVVVLCSGCLACCMRSACTLVSRLTDRGPDLGEKGRMGLGLGVAAFWLHLYTSKPLHICADLHAFATSALEAWC